MASKHIILTKSEEEELFEKYTTSASKLPKMTKDDPMAKYYGMKKGDICKIYRKSPVGDTIYYRVVV